MIDTNLTILIICAFFCIFFAVIAIGFSIFVLLKVTKIETQIEIWTKTPEVPYDKPINRRPEPPLKPTNNQINTEAKDNKTPKRTLHASEMKSAMPLLRARKRADEEMDKKMKDLGLLGEILDGNGNSE